MVEAVERGHLPRLPNRVANAPEISPGLEIYYTGYADLMTDRPPSFGGAMPIPWSAIARYSRFHEFSRRQFADFCYFMRELDLAFLEWHESRHGTNKKVALGGS